MYCKRIFLNLEAKSLPNCNQIGQWFKILFEMNNNWTKPGQNTRKGIQTKSTSGKTLRFAVDTISQAIGCKSTIKIPENHFSFVSISSIANNHY